MLIGKLKVRRIRYVKLYGMLLQYAFFCENEYVVHGWCDKKGNFSSPDIYCLYKKGGATFRNSNNLLKKSFAIFSEF